MEFEIVRGASFCEGDGVGYSARKVERAFRLQSTDKPQDLRRWRSGRK